MAEINVPVKLQIQNLQQLIGDLQSKLSNLKVGSTGFKSVQNIITSMKNELDKLQIQTSKPFIDANQFTRAESSVDKLEDELQKVAITLSRIKFTDLELTPQQKSDLQGFEDQINSIKASLKTVKDTAKQDFLGSAMGKLWKEQFDDTAITKSFSQITNSIRSEVNKQNLIVQKAQETLTNYQNAMKANTSIENFLKVKNPLEETNLGVDKYNEIFQNTKNGIRFRSGGSTILEDWLKTQLQLDDATISKLVDGSAQTVKAKLEERLKAIQLINQDTLNKNVNAESDAAAQVAKYEQLRQIMEQLGASETTVAIAEQALRQQLSDTSRAMGEYQENAVNAARSNEDIKVTSTAMTQQLESLRGTLQQTNGEFIRMQRTQQSFNQMKMAVVNFMGFNQVLNLTRNAIRNAISHIRELDTVMNGIAIVTDMSTSDLWNQVDAYSKMAQSYGVSIKGAYEVSQIYYQQGLQTADVLTLTNETLKLAKISGLDYATTTDYMTTAIRGFKMEMSEASTVVDVYSNLAAHTAVSQEELAVAMSKTASSMEGVGATFEEASAMIGTMVAVTRESATNIGSAMKSIASRYGELTKDPTKLVDEEGEAMAFNKVDAALQSVGISMKTVDGQFREFTDVIVELGEKWDQLDSVQQRYIATQFAGNRQQSRFLALVSNVDLLKSNLDVAMNSEDTGTLQALKALDSIESKTEQVRVAYQQFYTTIGAENVWKGFLDGAKNVINTLNSLPKLFGKIPIGAIAAISSIISLIKSLGIDLLNTFAQTFGQGILQGALQAQSQAQEGAQSLISIVLNTIRGKKGEFANAGKESAEAYTQGIQQGSLTVTPDQLTGQAKITYDKNNNVISEYKNNSADIQGIFGYEHLADSMYAAGQISKEIWDQIAQHPNQAKEILDQYIATLEKANQKLLETGNTADQSGSKLKNFISNHKNLGSGLQSFGSALNMVAMTINTTAEGGKTWSGVLQGMAAAATLASVAVKVLDSGLKSIPWMALASGVLMAINAISTLIVTPEERLEELEKKAEELSNKAKESKAEYNTLSRSVKKLDELKEKRYESAEATEEYQSAVDELADSFPALISGFDEAGNVIIETSNMEAVLTAARKRSAEAAYEAAQKEKELSEEKLRSAGKRAQASIGDISDWVEEFQQDYDTPVLNLNRLKWGESPDKTYENMIHVLSYFNYGASSLSSWSAEELENNLADVAYRTKTTSDLEYLQKYNLNTSLLEQAINDGKFDLQKYYNILNNNVADLTGADKEIHTILTTLVDETSHQIEFPEELSTGKALELTEQINQAIEDGDLTSLYDYYTQLNEQIELMKNSAANEESNAERYQKLESSLKELNNCINEMTEAAAQDVRNAAALVQSYIIKNNSQANFINDESGLTGIISANYSKIYQDEFKKNNKYTQEQFFKQYGEQLQKITDASEEFWNDLVSHGTNIKDKFVTMIKNNEDYRLSDFEQFEGLNNWQEIEAQISENYSKRIQTIQDDLYKFYNKQERFTGTLRFGRLISRVNTMQESQYFKDSFKEYSSLIDAGLTIRGNEYLTQALNLFDQSLNLSDELRIALWKSIEKNGFNTKEAIEKVRQEILNNDSKDDDIIADTLLNMSNAIVDNVRLAIQMASSEFVEGWSDSNKVIKSLSSGLDINEVEGLINSAAGKAANLSMDSFISDGEKLVLKASEIDNYIAKFFESERTTYSERLTQLTGAAKQFNITDKSIPTMVALQFKQKKTIEDFTEEDKEAFATLLGSEEALSNYFSEDGLNSIGLAEALIKAYEDSGRALSEYAQYIDWAEETVNISRAWAKGDYSNLKKSLPELKDLASGKLKLNADDVQLKSAKESINSAYDSLISDVLSKGFDNINLDDYSGLIDGSIKENVELALKKGSYEKFIKVYATWAGKSIQETNDLLLQAIEKDREKISVDLIKDLQFVNQTQFKTNLSGLNDLANKLNINLSQLMHDAIISSNDAIGEYIVDATKIKDFNLDSSEFQNTIRDSIQSFFDSLASYISSALKGSLGFDNARELQEFASAQGIGELRFTRTADGLKVAADQARLLVSEMEKLDSIQGQVLFNELKDNLIETEDAYKSITSMNNHIVQLQEKINVGQHKYQEQAGHVQLIQHARNQISGKQMQTAGWKEFNAEDYATLYSTTISGEDIGANVVFNITPITNDGQVLSPKALNEYVQSLMEKGDTAKDIMLKDTKNLVMGAWDVDVSNAKALADGINAASDDAERLHKESAAIAANIEDWDKPNDSRIKQYEQELELAQRIKAERITTEDDSFNFMSNKIPAAQNNPLNYWSNWYDAFEKMNATKTGKDKGKIAYEDFYNIVTEMGQLAELTGQSVNIGGRMVSDTATAANLITEAAGNLTNLSTGDIGINLGKIGISFNSGVDTMATNVDAGIKELAESQIDMLDSMIQLLETIVAMEELGKIDINGNGLDFNELFQEVTVLEDGTTIYQWTAGAQKAVDNIITAAEVNKDLANGLDQVILNGTTMRDMLKKAKDGIKLSEKDAQAYYAILSAFYRAMQSGDYSLENIYESIKNVLIGSGFEGNIDVGQLHLTITNQGVILERDQDNNYIVNGQKVGKDENIAIKAAVASDIEALQKEAKDIKTDGTVAYTGQVNCTVTYDVDSGYTVVFDNGDSVFSKTKAGINLAIQTWSKINNAETDTSIIDNEPITFTLHQQGNVDVIITVSESGEPQIKAIDPNTQKEVEIPPKEQEKYKRTVMDITESQTIAQNINVDASQANVNLTNLEGLSLSNTIESISGNVNELLLTPAQIIAIIQDIVPLYSGILSPIEYGILGALINTVVTNINGKTPIFVGSLNAINYPELAAAIETVKAEYNAIPNKDNVTLQKINWESLAASIQTIEASFSGKPNISNVTLDDINYSKAVGVILSSLMLSRGKDSFINSKTITIGDNEVEIEQIINALITGQLKLNGTGVEGIAGTITLADNTEVNIPNTQEIIGNVAKLLLYAIDPEYETKKIKLADGTNISLSDIIALVDKLIAEWADPNADHTPDFSGMVENEYEVEPATLVQKIIPKYEIEDSKFLETPNTSAGLEKNVFMNFIPMSPEEIQAAEKGWNGTHFDIIDNATFNNDYAKLQSYFNLLKENQNLTLNPDLITNIQTLQSSLSEGLEDPLVLDQIKELYNLLTQIINLNAEHITLQAELNTEKVEQEKEKIESTTAVMPITTEIDSTSVEKYEPPTKVMKVTTQVSESSNARIKERRDNNYTKAKGNIALSQGTLMGELGPELYVTGGRYYIAGQNGAEFVDLPDDAIVFNHLQTRRLMSTGFSSRGTPTTSEKNATSFATGNWNGGEAMASASAALAALKQLRAMWASLAKMNAKDLAGAGGSGGGGGGGNNDDQKAFLKDLEKWYNWLQEIDKLEQHITYQETLRSKIQSDMVAHGQDYFKSELISLDNLDKEVAIQKDLYESQAAYFEKRMAQLNSDSNPFSSLYGFDEKGQLKYKEGKLEQLSYMSGTDQYGKPNMTAEEQYNYIVNTLGIDSSYLQYDDSGNEIKKTDDDGKENENYYTEVVEAFWNKIDADKEEAQTLYDSVQEHKEAMVEKQGEINELLHDMEDNTIDLEGKVYDAIVDMKEREIKEFEDTRDQMKENNEALIDGLNKQLEAEKKAYETQESNDELTSLQRRLAILQRSGGSASEIASLEKEITAKQQDMYWESQQAEIDALQEASDTELEKLDAQIDLMTETLAYQKENGLLNAQVYEEMQKSPQQIANFIKDNNSEYWQKTPIDLEKTLREDLFSAQSYRAMMDEYGSINKLIEYYSKTVLGQEGNDEEAQQISDKINGKQETEETGTPNGSIETKTGTWKQNDTGWWYEYDDGSYEKNSWKTIDGKKYRFDENGYMKTGWYQEGDKWYYLGDYGALTGAQVIDGKTWNFDENGVWDGKDGVVEAVEGDASDTSVNEDDKKKNRGWHVAGLPGVYGSEGLAKIARNEKIKELSSINSTDAMKQISSLRNAKIKYYSEGGLDDYTGLAMLHGTKSKPEAIFNASQTHILRDEILSNKPDSLLSLLSDWRAAQLEMQKLYDINNNTSSISIEKAEVIMQVQHMNNDYDAQRAGDQALEQIMKIARKSIAQNRIGR